MSDDYQQDFDKFMEMCDISRELGVIDPELAIVSQRLVGECTGELMNYGEWLRREEQRLAQQSENETTK